ncbi:MAG: ABC transporter ATP-binding protein, partial [Thermoguttaceae bacterium]|nr:ABC transporter ATP-binding protein [Thermoguttaceae bacterium]
LINDPDLILLDEPTSGLDPIGTRNMKDLILELKAQGKTVIMSSHLLADVQDVCDRIGILYQGELKELGRVEDRLKINAETEIRAEGLSEEAKEKIRKIIAEDNSQLLYCDHPTSSLEDLFLNIISESEARPGKRVRGGGTD